MIWGALPYQRTLLLPSIPNATLSTPLLAFSRSRNYLQATLLAALGFHFDRRVRLSQTLMALPECLGIRSAAV